jgi:hypothetical protein
MNRNATWEGRPAINAHSRERICPSHSGEPGAFATGVKSYSAILPALTYVLGSIPSPISKADARC